MRHKSILILIILIMAIGFAAVSTTLVINGSAKVSENTDDFFVIFTAASLDGTDVYANTINDDKKTINFSTKELKTLKQSSVLSYEITNNSSNYDAEVQVTCKLKDNTEAKYTSIKNELEGNATVVKAKESVNGTLTVTLEKTATEEVNEQYVCELTFNAVERTKKAFFISNSDISDALNLGVESGLIPKLTSNEGSNGKAFASGKIYNGYEAWKSFNQDLTGNDAQNWASYVEEGNTGYLGYEFNKPVEVKSFYVNSLKTDNNIGVCMKEFVLQGSNDGNNWVDLTDKIMHSPQTIKYYPVTKNESSYKFYRLYGISEGVSNLIAIHELQLFDKDYYVNIEDGLVPKLTSNEGSNGKAFASGKIYRGYEAWKSFNQDLTGNDAQNWASYVEEGNTGYLGYEFKEKKKVNVFYVNSLKTDNNTGVCMKEFVLQGSNDGNNWIDLTDKIMHSPQTIKYYPVTKNESSYKFYRIYGISEGVGNLIAIHELQLFYIR